MFRIFLRIILSLWLSAPFVTPRISATSFCFKSRGGGARNLLMHLLMPDSLPNHAVIDRPVALAGNHWFSPYFVRLYLDGQIIWIHKQDTLEEGEIGIFFLDGEAYVKKYHQTDSDIQLISLNSKYSPINVSSESTLKTFGKVVGWMYKKADAVVIFSYHLCTSLFLLIIIMILGHLPFFCWISSPNLSRISISV